jgi:hypothetical protein
MAVRELNYERVEQAVNRCCKTEAECVDCKQNACLIGYCQLALAYSRQKAAMRIPQGDKHIPAGDFRTYYEEDLLQALIQVLAQCQDCRDNHEEECVINVVRSALELALFGDNIPYLGSAFLYLVEAGKRYGESGEKLLQRYNAFKQLQKASGA